jgi:hypothetical protein
MASRPARVRWLLAALALTALEGAASACLPPLPGTIEPTLEEQVRSAALHSSDIVYGEVIRGSRGRRRAQFRVHHAYKGAFRPGAVVAAELGWGLDPPMCVGMIQPPPVQRGARGVIFFGSGQPTLNFLGDGELELMFRLGLIAPGPHDRARPGSRR